MSLHKRIQSFGYAFQGIAVLFKTQVNARIHLLVAFCVLLAGAYFHISREEWMAVSICIGLVISMEAMNTAVEFLTDLVSPQQHPLAGKAKDLAAAAVLLATMAAVVTGLLIFLPKLKASF